MMTETIKEKKETRACKADVIKYVDHILDLIAANATKREIIKSLFDKFNIQSQQGTLYYLKACEQLQDDLDDKIANVRNKKILGLTKDLKEAYSNYTTAESEAIQVKWYEVYQKIKAQLDTYYPNGLKHESENGELKIEINYSGVKTGSDSEDE